MRNRFKLGVALFLVGFVCALRTANAQSPWSWVAELPSGADVRAAIHGSDAADTLARQAAAFSILLEYVHDHRDSLPAAMKPEAEARSQDYFNSEPAWTTAAERYSKDNNFQTDVLGRWLIAERRADEAAESARNLQNKERLVGQEKTLRFLEKDKKDARTGRVSLGVFGIQLGEPLRLPTCANEGSDACVRANDPMLGIVVGMWTEATRKSLPGVATGSPVKLPRSKCPSWLSECVVYLDLQDGIPVGAFVYTAGADNEDLKAIVAAMNDKYGNHMVVSKSNVHSCSNTLTGIVTAEVADRQWQVPGLRITYSPVVNCQLRQGTLRVRFRSVGDQDKKRHREAEPKM
jgi:hypothetical protein